MRVFSAFERVRLVLVFFTTLLLGFFVSLSRPGLAGLFKKLFTRMGTKSRGDPGVNELHQTVRKLAAVRTDQNS